MSISDRRWRPLRRLAVYVEPRDVWVGVFISPDAVYVCPAPCLVLRWTRSRVARHEH